MPPATRIVRGALPPAALCLGLMLLSAPAAPAVETLRLLALFEDKALLHVDGEGRMMTAGETSPEGVTLVRTGSESVTVMVDDKREVLKLGMMTSFPGASEDVSPAWDGKEKLTLWQEDDGFFYAGGDINGEPVRFLVDTGANTIALSRRHAERIGIDYRSGEQGMATTASGVTPMYLVTLEEVSVGEITLRDVRAGVLLGDYPDIPLLGMSFLGKLDMVRDGERLELKRR